MSAKRIPYQVDEPEASIYALVFGFSYDFLHWPEQLP
jgi:hypothetical protein